MSTGQAALAVTLGPAGLPVFTLPFTLSSLLVLLAWQSRPDPEPPQEKENQPEAKKQKMSLNPQMAPKKKNKTEEKLLKLLFQVQLT